MASQTSNVYSYTSGTNAAALSYGTSSVSQIQGAAIIFTEGATAFSEMSVAVDLGSRKLSGVMSGASMSANTISVMAPANSIYLYWQLTNNFSFNGAFNASLSKNWADNSFTGKGSLVITKFDPALYNQAAVGTSANVNPSNYVSSIPTSIKVRGVKTSDSTAPLWTTFNSTASAPTAVPIAR